MKILRAGVILTLFLSALLPQGCGGGGNINVNTRPPDAVPVPGGSTANAAMTNVEELALLVAVPYETEDVKWKPGDKKLVAVLRFSPADADKLVAESAKFGSAENVRIAVDSWFPEELTAQGEMSGDSTLNGTAYPANLFFQEPYSTGRITRIEGGNYFVLELTAN
jgi:hypothetical protein